MKPASIRFGCESCEESVDGLLPLAGGPVGCPACRAARSVPPDSAFTAGGRIVRCALCPGDDLYLQRDFPRRAGLTVMALGALAFLVLAGRGRILTGFAVLGGVAVADLVLFRFLPIVTVCYRCGAEVRGFPPNPGHAPFDLHLAEEAAKRAAVDRANREPAGESREAARGD